MTDQEILTRLQYHLIEAPDGGVSWPSGLWTREEILSALNQRQSKFLKETLLLVQPASPDLAVSAAVALPPPSTQLVGQTRVNLPTDLIRIVSLVWVDGSTGLIRELLRSDSFEADHAIPTWDQTPAAYPLVYMEYETPTLQVQIAPAPLNAGVLQLLYVPKGAVLAGGGTALAVPDEFGHAIQYGVLADMLSKDGRGKDPTRATYAEQRFTLAIDLARIILKGWP